MKEANGDLIEKLKFLGLDLENIPDYLRDFSPLNFNISRLNNDKDHRVYRYVPIDEIEILLTDSLRGDDIREKYSKAVPLGRFLSPDGEPDDIERYAKLLKIISTLSVTDIENIATVQKSLEKTEPFKVKYTKDHLWQIYYSPATEQYFMLVCTKEETFAEFLYLLKKLIEYKSSDKAKTVPTIFVPINYVNYSEEYLNRDEIANIENYLWLFTKNWPLVFEVYDKKGGLSLQVVGDTYVYNNVKSSYKVKLADKDSSIKFYKLLKALFILQTEVKNYFNFETKIDSKNGLELYFGKNRITYENLEDFIESEYKIARKEIEVQDDEVRDLKEKLESVKELVKIKENEYLEKQKEISTYLEYKKTFLGKVKYFFKSNKKTRKDEMQASNVQTSTKKIEMDPVRSNNLEDKRFYTIEDLVVIRSIKEKGEKKYKDVSQDLKAQELKLENLTSKVRNAELYIEEIDKHKKSIFEFWKFANKDEKLSLEMGNESLKNNEKGIIRKAFDYEMDFEELGIQVDRTQRVKLSKEETDSIYIASTELNPVINSLRAGNMNKVKIENALDELKEEFNQNRLYIDSETYDIFGNIDNDSRKIKYIGSRSHRENEKSKFRILNINKKIDVFDFTEKLLSIISYIEGAVPKITSKYDMPLYKVTPITENLEENSFEIFDINVENALSNFEDTGEGAVNLIKINFKENMPLLYYTNIMYFDNVNKTLPEGMDISSKVLVDSKRFDFKLVGKTKFRTNNYFNEQNNLILPKSKDILVYEYDVELKGELNEQSNDAQEEKSPEETKIENLLQDLENFENNEDLENPLEEEKTNTKKSKKQEKEDAKDIEELDEDFEEIIEEKVSKRESRKVKKEKEKIEKEKEKLAKEREKLEKEREKLEKEKAKQEKKIKKTKKVSKKDLEEEVIKETKKPKKSVKKPSKEPDDLEIEKMIKEEHIIEKPTVAEVKPKKKRNLRINLGGK